MVILSFGPPNAVISISYIGYITQNIKITNQTSLKVVMMDDTQALEEVVVVGYGSQKKANLTGAVSSVKMDEVLGDRPILNASDALQGAVPGLFVSKEVMLPEPASRSRFVEPIRWVSRTRTVHTETPLSHSYC